MLWGFPVLWLLGAVVPAAWAVTLVMSALLLRHRAVVLVPGVLSFSAFVVWTLPTALVLDSAERVLGFGFRTANLVFVLVALVYAVSARTLPRRRVVSGLAILWVFTVVGGLVGMRYPDVRIATPVGRVLPGLLVDNVYVRDLFFPALAEVQHPWGASSPFVRPAAPFPYANSWGMAIIVLTPVALACFLLVRGRLVRCLLVVVGVAMTAPAAATSNRAMLAALALALGYVVVRLAARDRAVPVLVLTLLATGGLLWLHASGALGQIDEREHLGRSTEARLALYAETIDRVRASPVLGFGAPRPSVDQELSLGTQGQVWAVLFSHGVVGLGLFLVFLWGTTWRTRRAPSDVDVVLHSVLVVTSGVVLVYGLDVMQMFSLVLVAALLLRRCHDLDAEPDRVARA